METSNANEIKRRAFIRTVAATASLPFLGAAALGEAEEASKSSGGSHKILTCNIRLPLAQDDRAGNGWNARREFCADVMRRQHADLICLQECYGVQLDYLKGQLPGFECYGLARPAAEFNPTNAILFSASRYDLISAGGFWLSETPHVAGSMSWDCAVPRFTNWVHLKDSRSGREFQIWNTHLDHKGQLAREQQSRLVVEGCGAFGNVPQLLTGDFNADAANPAVATLKEGGWVDTYTAVHGSDDPGFTYHGFVGPKFAARAGNGKIDFVFCRGDVRPQAAEILRDNREGRYPSDHYFISAEISLEPPVKAV